MNVTEALERLPNTEGAVIILSGGMDSTIAMRLAVEKYGAENVSALTFFYGQKQSLEIEKASESTKKLGVRHKILDLSILGDISQGFSANVDTSMAVPKLEEVLGDPQPKTYVPNRNMILLSLAVSFAETVKAETVLCGLQVSDLYGYWDTTAEFLAAMNSVITQNRTFKPVIVAPFSDLLKEEELKLLIEMDGSTDLLKHTLSCYTPDEHGNSCGECATCRERLNAFRNIGQIDPIPYV